MHHSTPGLSPSLLPPFCLRRSLPPPPAAFAGLVPQPAPSLLLSPHAAPQAPAPELSHLPPSRLLAAALPPPSPAPQAAPGLPSLHSPWLSSAASWRTSASLPFPHIPGLPRAPRCLPPRSRLGQLRDRYTERYIYIYTHTCARLSQFLCAACTGPEFKRARRIKGPATWHLNRTARQMDGTSCGSFPWGTSVTCENCGHRAVPEKDVSSPTFNSGISRANGIKHALKAFEGTIFQLLFSMPDDSVVQSISPGDAVNRESHGRKRSFPSSMLGKQKAG